MTAEGAAGGVTIWPLAESGLLVELGEGIDPALVGRVAAMTAAIDAAALPGVVDVVPSYRTIVLAFDPTATDGEAAAAAVRRLAAAISETAPGTAGAAAGREVAIAVAYGGEDGPDLAAVAARTGLGPGEVAARHAAGEYRVACMGFAPGFAFLVGLPPELATPRRDSPRLRVPAGSVGIGGEQTGIYPFPTPGGWNLIGRTGARLFDPERPEPFLLRPGDRVRFRAVAEGGAEEDAAATTVPGVADRLRPVGAPVAEQGRVIGVLEPGLSTTVQDLGRPGLMRFGVAPGGALDRTALILGNRLVGNPAGSAALEIALIGPRLRFERAAVIALTGADLGARWRGSVCPLWQPLAVAAGDEVVWGKEGGRGDGARAYVCVAGGIAVEPVMGSRSTDLFAGFGGWQGRALRAGEALPIGEPAGEDAGLLRRRLAETPPRHDPAAAVRVVLGPQAARFTAEGVAGFLGGGYAVSGKADRTGLRLEGPPVGLTAGADLVSEGIAHGAIQVPGDGLPIVLLAARQTIGGYPKIGTVIGADLDGLGQRRPGEAIRFAAVEVGEARAATLAMLAARAALAEGIGTAPRVVAGWSAEGDGNARGSLGEEMGTGTDLEMGGGTGSREAWTPSAVGRLVAELRAAGVGWLRLEVAGAGISLELRFGGSEPSSVAEHGKGWAGGGEGAGGGAGVVVAAPLLGVFYRRPNPGAPPFVEAGQAVAGGDVLGLIEVMKTYHEVTAPAAGVVREFLVEEGAFVEFGQGVARLEARAASEGA